MKENDSWIVDLQALRQCLDRARKATFEMRSWLHEQLGSANLPPIAHALVEEIDTAASLAEQISDRLHHGPLNALFSGRHLSREAFYSLVSLGVLKGGSYSGDPHADFEMLRYEDDECQCYISPSEVPFPEPEVDPKNPGVTIQRIWIRRGTPPEEIYWERLRPEQQHFFQQWLPDVARRFKREG